MHAGCNIPISHGPSYCIHMHESNPGSTQVNNPSLTLLHESKGVLEVKTVYTIDGVNVTNVHSRQLASNPKCCLQINEGEVQLN